VVVSGRCAKGPQSKHQKTKKGCPKSGVGFFLSMRQRRLLLAHYSLCLCPLLPAQKSVSYTCYCTVTVKSEWVFCIRRRRDIGHGRNNKVVTYSPFSFCRFCVGSLSVQTKRLWGCFPIVQDLVGFPFALAQPRLGMGEEEEGPERGRVSEKACFGAIAAQVGKSKENEEPQKKEKKTKKKANRSFGLGALLACRFPRGVGPCKN
jgi:hypothetical protein